MYPMLFDKSATSYNDNMGLGILSDALSCNINIIRNDANTLVMQYPTDGNIADRIDGDKVIVIQSPDWVSPQPYYISKITAPRKGIITVHANHASYRLSGVMVKPFTCSAQTNGILMLLSAITDNIAGNYNISTGTGSDAGGAVSYTLDKVTSMRQVLIDVATKFGCTLSFIQFYSHNGEDYMQVNAYPTPDKRALPLYEGIDIDNAVYNYDATNAYEGVFPHWHKNDVTVYCNTIVPSGLPSYARVIPLDVSSEFETQPTQAQLRQAGQSYLNAGGGQPVTGWTITANGNVQDINVGDVVDVALSDGTVVTNVIESATWDALAQRYTKITLGNTRRTLYKAIKSIK